MKLSEQEAGEGASGWGDERHSGLGKVKGSRKGLRLEIPLPTAPRHPSALLWGLPPSPEILLTLPGTCSKWGPWRNCQAQGSMGIVDAESSHEMY